MDFGEYQKYTRSLGRLPVLSSAYVFGHTIPRPKTDKNGHIHVAEPPPPEQAAAPPYVVANPAQPGPTTQALSAAPSRASEILAFGDSLTAGFGLSREEAFPAQLEAWLRGRGVPTHVINAGVSGETTAMGRERLNSNFAGNPDLVILELGANDALRGVDPAVVRDNLAEMVQKIQASGARLLLTGVLAPPNWGREYQRAFDPVFPELARAYRVSIYPFFLEGIAGDPRLNQPDGLHPNDRGVAKLVDRIGPVIERLLQR